MSRIRTNNMVIEVSGPQTAIGTESTNYTKVQEVISCDFNSVKKALIENPQQGATSFGTLPPVAGLYYDNAKPTVEMNIEGARSVAEYSASAAPTAFAHMLASVAQFSSSLHPRSKVVSATSTSDFVEDYHNAHSGSANGTKERICLFPIEDATDGTIEIVAGLYSSYNTLALKNGLSFTPAADDVIYSAINHQFADTWNSAVNPYAITLRQLGNAYIQNKKAIGAVGTATIGAIAPNEVPKISFSFQAASGSTNFADTRPATSPVKPKCYAGSQLKFGFSGYAVDLTSICGRVDITLGIESIPEQCPNSDVGMAQWLRNAGSCEVKISFSSTLTPNTLNDGEFSETSWTEFLEGENTGCFQLLASYGQNKPGSIFAVYFPELQVVMADEGDEDGYGITTLTLRPKQDSVYPAYVDCIA